MKELDENKRYKNKIKRDSSVPSIATMLAVLALGCVCAIYWPVFARFNAGGLHTDPAVYPLTVIYGLLFSAMLLYALFTGLFAKRTLIPAAICAVPVFLYYFLEKSGLIELLVFYPGQDIFYVYENNAAYYSGENLVWIVLSALCSLLAMGAFLSLCFHRRRGKLLSTLVILLAFAVRLYAAIYHLDRYEFAYYAAGSYTLADITYAVLGYAASALFFGSVAVLALGLRRTEIPGRGQAQPMAQAFPAQPQPADVPGETEAAGYLDERVVFAQDVQPAAELVAEPAEAGGEAAEEPPAAAETAKEQIPAAETVAQAAAPKKRGRKKKTGTDAPAAAQDTAGTGAEAAEQPAAAEAKAEALAEIAAQAAAPKKRGRKKKAETDVPAAAQDTAGTGAEAAEQPAAAEATSAETPAEIAAQAAAPKKRGRKKKAETDVPDTAQDLADVGTEAVEQPAAAEATSAETPAEIAAQAAAPKKRGRKKKAETDATSAAQDTADASGQPERADAEESRPEEPGLAVAGSAAEE